MKTTMVAVMLAACVLFVGAMVRMQHATFADRARRERSLAAPAPEPIARPIRLAAARRAALAGGEPAH